MAENTKPLVKFNEFKINGIQLDPTSIETLDIFESIDLPGVFGQLAFKDVSNIKESANIFAGDEIILSFSREDEELLLLRNMVICDSYGDEINVDEDLNNLATFGFCNKWMIDGNTRKRSRSFRNRRIDQIVTDLLLDSGVLKSNIGTITETSQTLDRYVTPYISPIAAIQNLMDYATDVNGNGGYILYTDIFTDLVHFQPIGALMRAPEELDERLVDFTFRMNPVMNINPEAIYNLKLSQQFDIVKHGSIGMGNTRLVGFNFDRTAAMETNTRIDEYSDNHLSTKLPLNTQFLGRIYRTTKDSFRFPNTAELIRLETDASNHINGKLNTMYNNLSSDAIEINVTCYGEASRKRAGRLIKVDFPSVEKHILNTNHSGTYLIRAIRHTIQGMEYGQQVTLIADGYKETDKETMISWQNPLFENSEADDFVGDNFDRDNPEEDVIVTSEFDEGLA